MGSPGNSGDNQKGVHFVQCMGGIRRPKEKLCAPYGREGIKSKYFWLSGKGEGKKIGRGIIILEGVLHDSRNGEGQGKRTKGGAEDEVISNPIDRVRKRKAPSSSSHDRAAPLLHRRRGVSSIIDLLSFMSFVPVVFIPFRFRLSMLVAI